AIANFQNVAGGLGEQFTAILGYERSIQTEITEKRDDQLRIETHVASWPTSSVDDRIAVCLHFTMTTLNEPFAKAGVLYRAKRGTGHEDHRQRTHPPFRISAFRSGGLRGAPEGKGNLRPHATHSLPVHGGRFSRMAEAGRKDHPRTGTIGPLGHPEKG